MGVYAAIAVAATIFVYLVYHVVVSLPFVVARRRTVAGVVLKRLAGVLILGVLTIVTAKLLLMFSLAQLGLSLEIPPSTWLWVLAASLIIVPGCLATAHKSANFDVYPEMRAQEWGLGAIAANSISSAVFMFAYEFLFRGFLLFSCLAAMTPALAIGINVLLYVLAHVAKGPREALGSIPLGLVLCLATIDTGTIWAAFLIHSVMSQLNDYLAVRANPEMRFAFKGLAR